MAQHSSTSDLDKPNIILLSHSRAVTLTPHERAAYYYSGDGFIDFEKALQARPRWSQIAILGDFNIFKLDWLKQVENSFSN